MIDTIKRNCPESEEEFVDDEVVRTAVIHGVQTIRSGSDGRKCCHRASIGREGAIEGERTRNGAKRLGELYQNRYNLAMSVVRRLREMVGMTQGELAESGGTSQPAIAAYESGAKLPSLRTLQRLASAVGLDLHITVIPSLTREERRSLAIHARIAEHLRVEPETTLAKAKVNLEQMRRLHPHAGYLLDEWERILEQPLDFVADALTDVRPHYRELRQVTPFAGVLDQEKRAEVYRQFRREEAVR